VESVFYDRFKSLCDQRGISCNKAALEMGLSNATPTAWKKRGLTPKADTLEVIANYFGVSTDYLIGKEEKENSPSELKLTEGEKDLLELFRLIPEDQQPVVLAMIRAALGK
jgi:transcriptional regulator with XRE-family HTH domain